MPSSAMRRSSFWWAAACGWAGDAMADTVTERFEADADVMGPPDRLVESAAAAWRHNHQSAMEGLAVLRTDGKVSSAVANAKDSLALDGGMYAGRMRAVTRLVTPTSLNVDLRAIRIVKKVGETIEDTELVNGVVLNQNVVTSVGGPTQIEKAKIGIIHLKSILRDAVDDIFLTFLKRLNILTVKDVERDEIEFLSKSLGAKPIADIDAFTEDKLGYDLVEETTRADAKANKGRTVSVLAMGSNGLVLEEYERSLHDAPCVVRCLVKKRALIAGGGAPEIHYAHSLKGLEACCFQAYADALEVIPTTLAEKAGLQPIAIVTELRNRHTLGERNAGINVRKGLISNILEEVVVQSLLVSTSAIELSTETVCLLLNIDDYVQTQ
ncbi:TCP-1/cpn60 chaperonin family-domain-containing protein [Daedaleopsis nitida]|nr:TCP-1/cpn60 chaperonin family-domain-containing protein [Daedaleopsis nitida]